MGYIWEKDRLIMEDRKVWDGTKFVFYKNVYILDVKFFKIEVVRILGCKFFGYWVIDN